MTLSFLKQSRLDSRFETDNKLTLKLFLLAHTFAHSTNIQNDYFYLRSKARPSMCGTNFLNSLYVVVSDVNFSQSAISGCVYKVSSHIYTLQNIQTTTYLKRRSFQTELLFSPLFAPVLSPCSLRRRRWLLLRRPSFLEPKQHGQCVSCTTQWRSSNAVKVTSGCTYLHRGTTKKSSPKKEHF